LGVRWFSDEAHLHVDGYVSNYNVRFWNSYSPTLTVANPLHPEIFAVWIALPSFAIFGPMFIDGSVNSDVYHRLLRDEFIPFLMGYGSPVISALFQQNGARPHTSNAVHPSLHGVYGDSLVEVLSE
jgi:hypothetical protein